jgi:hypothetical protein
VGHVLVGHVLVGHVVVAEQLDGNLMVGREHGEREPDHRGLRHVVVGRRVVRGMGPVVIDSTKVRQRRGDPRT